MPRANRYYMPGYVWHITHRCHKQEFLLKFNRDKKRWVYWLNEARNKYRLKILNYIVTSNHIHLLIVDHIKGAIARSLQLIEGRVGQEYNLRKKREGAFWSDRYHATIIDTDNYLQECLMYIDLNMVRAGVVSHPEEWIYSGFYELHCRQRRTYIIDEKLLISYLGFSKSKIFKKEYPDWIDNTLQKGKLQRENYWTESIAVGKESFLDTVKEKLSIRGKNRRVDQVEDSNVLHEPPAVYKTTNISIQNCYLSGKNSYKL